MSLLSTTKVKILILALFLIFVTSFISFQAYFAWMRRTLEMESRLKIIESIVDSHLLESSISPLDQNRVTLPDPAPMRSPRIESQSTQNNTSAPVRDDGDETVQNPQTPTTSVLSPPFQTQWIDNPPPPAPHTDPVAPPSIWTESSSPPTFVETQPTQNPTQPLGPIPCSQQLPTPSDPTFIPTHNGYATVVRFQPDFPAVDYSDPQVYHIAIASEPEYGGLVTCLSSIFEHNHENFRIHLITSMGSTEKIQTIVDCLKPRARVRIYEFNPSLMPFADDALRDNRKELFHAMNFAKFYIPLILSTQISKFLMLDSDTVTVGSLVPLFELHLQDPQFSIAAFPYGPYTTYGDVKFTHPVYKELGVNIQTLSTKYTSAGVLLVNPRRWRELNITFIAERLVQENNKEKIYSHVTQGPINVAHKRGSVEYFDRKWNFEGLGQVKPGGHSKQFMKGVEEAVILHFSGMWKPWKFKNVRIGPFKTWNDHRRDECEVDPPVDNGSAHHLQNQTVPTTGRNARPLRNQRPVRHRAPPPRRVLQSPQNSQIPQTTQQNNTAPNSH